MNAAVASMRTSTVTVTCPITGRVGVHAPAREHRPRPELPARRFLDPDTSRCPFCRETSGEPSAPGASASRASHRWVELANRYPLLDGPAGSCPLAVADGHRLPLTRPHAGLGDDWAALTELLQRLSGRAGRWAMPLVNVGVSAGGSLHHPHGHVLSPAGPPPADTLARCSQLARPHVARQVLDDQVTVAQAGTVQLVAPHVPAGPGDLQLISTVPGRFVDADPDAVGQLVRCWVEVTARRWPADTRSDADPPFDGKLVVHDLPPGRAAGRWHAELHATSLHRPSDQLIGLVPVPELATDRAATARSLLSAGEPAVTSLVPAPVTTPGTRRAA